MARPPALVVAVITSLVVWSACRGDDSAASSSAWICTCQRSPSQPPVEIDACAPTAGEAAQLAMVCLEQQQLADVRFCDCLQADITFCEPGSCFSGARP